MADLWEPSFNRLTLEWLTTLLGECHARVDSKCPLCNYWVETSLSLERYRVDGDTEPFFLQHSCCTNGLAA